MKIAIIGAGISGLSAAIALERSGMSPDIFEQNAMVGQNNAHMALVFSLTCRDITDNPLSYLNTLLSMELIPQNVVKNLVLHSQNSTAKINQEIGYSFISGIEPNSLQNQLYRHIRAKVKFEAKVELEQIKNEYQYVIVATSSRVEDFIAEKYLSGFQPYLVVFARTAMLYGDFDPNTTEAWINKATLKNGNAILIPYSSKRANFYVAIPDVKSWDEYDLCWKNFVQKEELLTKHHLLGISQRVHITSNAKTRRWENCFFVGDGAGFLDPFLGLGVLSGIASGVMAAKAIVENKDFDQLINPFKKEIERTQIHRTMFNNMTDEFIDGIVTVEDNPIVQKILYGTDINWFTYGALSAAPLAMIASKPSIADFHQLSDTHTHIH